MSDYLDPANEELLQDFFAEADQQVEALESSVLVLETDPSNSDAIDEIFRAAHTLKGGSATVQMTELAEFTHLVEDSLDAIRNGTVVPDETVVDILLISIDVVKSMLDKRRDGDVYAGDISEISEQLRSLLGETSAEEKATSGVSSPVEPFGTEGQGIKVKVSFREDNPMNSVGGIQVYAALKKIGDVVASDPDFDALYEDVFRPVVTYTVVTDATAEEISTVVSLPDVTESVSVTEALREPPEQPLIDTKAATPEPVLNSTAAPTDTPSAASKGSQVAKQSRSDTRKVAAGSILRVDSRRIDDLLNLVSETVINKASLNQVSVKFADDLSTFQTSDARFRDTVREMMDVLSDHFQKVADGHDPKEVRRSFAERYSAIGSTYEAFQAELKDSVSRLRNTAQNLGRIAGELQEGVMRIRMVPISQIFSRFPRLVRDLSKSLKKTIELEISGEDTELDKSIIEDLLDPLIHCVRNSIDHGIENPADRIAAGKPQAGTVWMRARNEGNMIVIEVEDDGKGIDVDAIRAKAITKGIIHPNKQLLDVEAFNLMFDPGFSTAAEVTNVSGRGVGLDVVRKQIEKLNGTVTVWSTPGEGSRFTIKIPLTLAIIQGLLVRVGEETYAIPITSVIDSHRIQPSEIKSIDGYEVFNLREDVVSLVRLNRLFRIPTEENPDYHYVVIVGTQEKKMGLIVDSLIGEEDVVIKPLSDHFTNTPGIAGANITGDGNVSLIIDVGQLLELGLNREREAREKRASRELEIGRYRD